MRDFLTLLLATAAFAHKQMEEAMPIVEEPVVDHILESLGQPEPTKDLAYYFEHYQMEACALVLFACAIVYLFYGKGQNEKIAGEWHLKSLPEIRKQFALVGHNDTTNSTNLE